MKELLPAEIIESKILLIRRHKVMIDSDLAALYGVETKNLLRAVKRNINRFPSEFMFQLDKEEVNNLRLHFGTSSQWGGRRYLPYAFTEQGVSMLSSVLNSERAIQINIAIMKTFVKMREFIATNKALAKKLAELEKKLESHDKNIKVLFDAIKQLMSPAKPSYKPKIGFK